MFYFFTLSTNSSLIHDSIYSSIPLVIACIKKYNLFNREYWGHIELNMFYAKINIVTKMV